jgi:hypothetical protein
MDRSARGDVPCEVAMQEAVDAIRAQRACLAAWALQAQPSCTVSERGVTDDVSWRDEQWARFFTAAPARLRQSVERYERSEESVRALARRYGISPDHGAEVAQTGDHGRQADGPF